ncbi:MAG: XdhC family protein [Bacteroidota bacterium]
MLDIFPQLQEWTQAKKNHAIATVISTWGSSPRVVGASLAISEQQEMLGSVSGGCVEGAVVREAMRLLPENQASRLDYGVSDDDAWTVGLSCGGKLSVWLEPGMAQDERAEERAAWQALSKAVANQSGGVLIHDLSGNRSAHGFWQPDDSVIGTLEDAVVQPLAEQAFRERKSQLMSQGERTYFAKVFPCPSQLLVIGVAHITVDLVELAKSFGFETVVVDPRGIFTQKTPFSTPPDQLHENWPQEVLPQLELGPYTYAALLTHDPKVDDPAIHLLLDSEVAYIGALGGRKTQQKRRNRLAEAGYSEEQIARIRGPIGLNIHAKTPREIALSILAEIIQVKNQHL